MGMNKENYERYVQVLKEELVPAMGCTEPIAIAYCAAKAREVLGDRGRPGRSQRQRKYHQECEERHRSQYRRTQRNRGGRRHRHRRRGCLSCAAGHRAGQ